MIPGFAYVLGFLIILVIIMINAALNKIEDINDNLKDIICLLKSNKESE